MSSDTIIEVNNLGKCYHIFASPQDRLKELIFPKLQNLISPVIRLFKPTWTVKQKYSHEFWAVSGVSFELKRGETVGIIGRNGSGKSTLLQLICGTLTPTVGTVKVSEKRVAALLELGAGFNPEFTGRENVYLNASLYGLSKKETDERYDKILDFAQIGEFIHQPVKVYSSGMFLRLAFAVIANIDADVLIVDEALSVGDVFFQQKCMRFLNKFREKGAILFVSHDTHSVSNLCNYAIWLDAGKVRAMGKAKAICEQYYGQQYLEHALNQQQMLESASVALESENLTKEPDLAHTHEELSLDSSQEPEVKELQYDGIGDFGTGGATIFKVELLDSKGLPLTWMRGGETIELVIKAKPNQDIKSPIIGFVVKDRLGQNLFGDNTYLTNPVEKARKSSILEARFHFVLPFLRGGKYSIAAQIASGTIDEHVQLHWIHDAIAFSVHADFRYEILLSVPMKSVSMIERAS